MGIMRSRAPFICAFALAFAWLGSAVRSEGSTVRVERTADGFRLLRDGQPYFIHGAGGVDSEFLMDQLVAAGGNSIRTWNAKPELKAQLDMAQARGLTLTPTLWMGRDNNTAAGKGPDYSNPASVQAVIDRARESVLAFKDHPALLVWGVGNEMESHGADHPDLWKAIDRVAAMVHETDPGHPTMTVIADLGKGGEKVKSIQQYCPHIDILGVNSYGGAMTLAKRLAETGWDRPYIVTEFGDNYLGLKKTPWGAKLEPTTTQRAAKLAAIYKASIAPGHPSCLGSYVFVWKIPSQPGGFHNCFTAEGGRLGHVDAMTTAWTGKAPKNRCPEIEPLVSEAKGSEIAPGAQVEAATSATDPDGDPLKAKWEVWAEDTAADKKERFSGQPLGSGEAPIADGSVQVAFQAPEKPGAYRLFVTVTGGAGNAAAANMPFRVRGENDRS
ncbi:MAG: hypothetical protein NTW86_17870 [Candidatus Sumerlaeota bacterium]|nr:hypothetical protein [Candidatus Sumerlaeota bacterium]